MSIVTCFQSVLKTYIIVVNKSIETGNPQLRQHTCDNSICAIQRKFSNILCSTMQVC